MQNCEANISKVKDIHIWFAVFDQMTTVQSTS